MSAVKYLWPTNRLKALLTTPGGKSRAEALAGAQAELSQCRSLAEEGVARALDAIDAILAEARGRDLTRSQTYAIMQNTERLASIATVMDMPLMCRVAGSMGELGVALLDAPSRPHKHLAVHARAARWAAENAHLSQEEAEPVLSGLLKIVDRAGPRPAAAPAA